MSTLTATQTAALVQLAAQAHAVLEQTGCTPAQLAAAVLLHGVHAYVKQCDADDPLREGPTATDPYYLRDQLDIYCENTAYDAELLQAVTALAPVYARS